MKRLGCVDGRLGLIFPYGGALGAFRGLGTYLGWGGGRGLGKAGGRLEAGGGWRRQPGPAGSAREGELPCRLLPCSEIGN